MFFMWYNKNTQTHTFIILRNKFFHPSYIPFLNTGFPSMQERSGIKFAIFTYSLEYAPQDVFLQRKHIIIITKMIRTWKCYRCETLIQKTINVLKLVYMLYLSISLINKFIDIIEYVFVQWMARGRVKLWKEDKLML